MITMRSNTDSSSFSLVLYMTLQMGVVNGRHDAVAILIEH